MRLSRTLWERFEASFPNRATRARTATGRERKTWHKRPGYCPMSSSIPFRPDRQIVLHSFPRPTGFPDFFPIHPIGSAPDLWYLLIPCERFTNQEGTDAEFKSGYTAVPVGKRPRISKPR